MAGIVLLVIVLLMWGSILRVSFRKRQINKQTPSQEKEIDKKFYCDVETQVPFAEDGHKEFVVRIRGCVIAPSDMHDTDIQITLFDAGDTPNGPEVILSNAKQWQAEDSPAFCYRAHNGKIPRRVSVLSEWVEVVRVRSDFLKFPRQGKRKLKFVVSVISREMSSELAKAETIISYENTELGYIDNKESCERARELSVQLTVVLCLSGGKLTDAAADTIEKWINETDKSNESQADATSMKKQLLDTLEEAKTVEDSEQYDVKPLCNRMKNYASILECYNAVELCLWAAGAGRKLSRSQMETLQEIRESLDVDEEKFTAMVQKVLPLKDYEHEDIDFILGIRSGMDEENIRRRINSQYRKWNSRVTHPDGEIAAQADRMLEIIAEARKRYLSQAAGVS